MAYRNTLQADALKLVAKKLQGSRAVEGELPEDGLAADGDTGDDLMMALARKLIAGETDDEPVEDIFQQAQQVAAEADQLLVVEGWKSVEAEPLLVGVNGNDRSDGLTIGTAGDFDRSASICEAFCRVLPAPFL